MSSKRAIRAEVLANRRAMTLSARQAADQALIAAASKLARKVGGRDARITAYIPIVGEPGGPGLVEALAQVVKTVLLPVLRTDLDLDWAVYEGADALGFSASNGGATRLRAPIGPRLGRDAVVAVDLMFVPALAVDRAGVRLGRGGGSFDRALARVPPGTPVVAVLYDGDLRDALTAEAHDRPVTAVLTPSGLHTVPTGMV